MKKITLLCAFLLTSFSMLAQVFPEGFETGVPPTDWTSFRGTNGEGDVYDWTIIPPPSIGQISLKNK